MCFRRPELDQSPAHVTPPLEETRQSTSSEFEVPYAQYLASFGGLSVSLQSPSVVSPECGK